MLRQAMASVWARWVLLSFWLLDAVWAFSRGLTGKGVLALVFAVVSAWLAYVKRAGRSQVTGDRSDRTAQVSTRSKAVGAVQWLLLSASNVVALVALADGAWLIGSLAAVLSAVLLWSLLSRGSHSGQTTPLPPSTAVTLSVIAWGVCIFGAATIVSHTRNSGAVTTTQFIAAIVLCSIGFCLGVSGLYTAWMNGTARREAV